MKKIALVFASFLLAAASYAQTLTPTANAALIQTRNPANNGTIPWYAVPLPGSVEQLLTWNPATLAPEYSALGPGFFRVSQQLNFSPTSTMITDSTVTGRALLTATDSAAARTAIGAGASNFSGIYADLSAIPSTFPPAAHTQDWSTITGVPAFVTSSSLTAALGSYATTADLANYATTSALTSGLAGKFNTPSGTTSQYVRGDGSLSTLPGATAFNFSQPAARTLAVSTSYQANDPTKAAIIYPSYACQNATQVLVSSACTLQVRMGTSALTCGTGTVYHTQNLSVSLGLLLTQNSTNPVPIFLPAGGHFIICPTAGTFTITAIEQSAG